MLMSEMRSVGNKGCLRHTLAAATLGRVHTYLIPQVMRSVIHARDMGGRAETAGRAGVIREYPHLMEHYPRPDGISSPRQMPHGRRSGLCLRRRPAWR